MKIVGPILFDVDLTSSAIAIAISLPTQYCDKNVMRAIDIAHASCTLSEKIFIAKNKNKKKIMLLRHILKFAQREEFFIEIIS